MRRDTVCRSIYSDMSMRMMALSSPNMASARDLHSSVFPTPVGPRKRKEPVGRLGSFRPTRPRRMARATAWTASSWPTTRLWRISSIRSRRLPSSSVRRVTGMPVQPATTAAMSSAVTGRCCRGLERRFSRSCSTWSW